ncbi:MAG: hypothetical protein U1E27_04625 [Kiritimatiellia bacterium]|nr:hypothetical protein [Kiritimatiellia bacterium]
MKAMMDRGLHHESVQRALALGRGTDPAVLPELVRLASMPSAEIRRLAASAIGKLAGFGADPALAVKTLAPIAFQDPHPQARQYALKALKAYGVAAREYLRDLDDLAENPREKDYVRMAAGAAARTIREAVAAMESRAVYHCRRCDVVVTPEEIVRSRKAFQRILCDHCFDEVFLDRRNFETKVELQKTIRAQDGTLVQSDGERRIAEWLARHRIGYRYDERFRILDGYAIRPDFYLPEYDVYIEYWGMDTADYKIGMLKKQQLYQQQGKKLISLHWQEKATLEADLEKKLAVWVGPPGGDPTNRDPSEAL